MALQIVRNFLDDLNASGIDYCHWKSNEHLQASVDGDTDLDMLFAEAQKEQVVNLLTTHNFHLFTAVWYRTYKGIVDYIGFDKKTGKIVHVHTHFKLAIGEVGIKSFHLPWEKTVLAQKVYDKAFAIFKSSPAIEYLLLVVRTAFKHDVIDAKSNRKIARQYITEAADLWHQFDWEGLETLSTQLLDNSMTALVKQIWEKKVYDKALFVRLKKALKPYFKPYRVMSPQRVALLKGVHLLKRGQKKIRKQLHSRKNGAKRHLPKQGVIVSLMGPDGAGKSTQTKELVKELAKKVDHQYVYMGSGGGRKSRLRNGFGYLITQLKPQHNNTQKTDTRQGNTKEKPVERRERLSLKHKILLFTKAVLIAREKRKRLKLAKRARQQGKIVICDRYPQTSVLGYNDGPKLNRFIKASNVLLRALARYERASYQRANAVPPDVVIKLLGAIKVLHARRPEMTVEEIKKKQEGIKALQFPAATQTCLINIDQPVAAIKGKILTAITHQISQETCA